MELKKCPFCGGEPEMFGGDDVYHGEPFWYVGCRCLASMKGEETMEGAAENWNRRAEGLPSAQPEIVRCRDCKHRIMNEHYGEHGYPNLKAECEWDTGDPYGLGRNAEDDEWFCADGERREDDVDPSDR